MDIVTEDFLIDSDTPGIRLQLRRKRAAGAAAFGPDRTLLLMHGATYSSASLFDVPVGGFSFMDYLARHGYDVWAVDARGYGGSSRPPEMADPPDRHLPIGRTASGVRDLGAAVDFVLAHCGLEKLNLVAMSWGGSVAGAYTAAHGARVAKLALVAPLWLSDRPLPVDPGGALGAYRHVPVAKARERWVGAAPPDRRAGLIPDGWFDAWSGAALRSDPDGGGVTMRAVNGPIQDIRDHWTAGRPLYDPADITVPVLQVHAEWDIDVTVDTARDFFCRLTAAPYRRWVEIGEGTHMVLMEKNRLQAFDAVRRFLDESYSPEV